MPLKFERVINHVVFACFDLQVGQNKYKKKQTYERRQTVLPMDQ